MNSPRIFLTLGILALLVACSSSGNNSDPMSNLPQFYKDTYGTQATYYSGYDSGKCSFGTQTDTSVAAINSSLYNNASLCGAYIEVTGDKGTVTVKVVDECIGSSACDGNHLDLSTSAYDAVTSIPGITSVNWKFVQAPVGSNPIELRWGSSLNDWFIDVVVDVHRHPVSTVEVQDSSSAFVTLTRNSANHFQLSSSSAFPNPIVIRITDMFGHQVQDTVSRSPDTTTATTMQFPEY